jgi:hypothetical protein
MKSTLTKFRSLSLAVTIIVGINFQAKAQNGGQPPDFEKFKAAADTCATELGIDSQSAAPDKLSADLKSKMDTCLSKKGFQPPPNLSGHRPGPADFEKGKAAADACATELGIDPQSVAPDKLSAESRNRIEACLSKKGFRPLSNLSGHVPGPGSGRGPRDEKFREAADACATQIGIDPQTLGREPLTEEMRAKIDTCLGNKGFKRPPLPPDANSNFSESDSVGSAR